MFIRVLVQAVRTLRRAGWRALAIATLYVVAVALVLPQPSVLLFVGMTVQNVVTFALIRQLAASRGITAKRDVPASPNPFVAFAMTRPGPVSENDVEVRRALTAGGQLGRSAMRLAIIQLFQVLMMVTLLLLIGGERVLPDEQPTQQQMVRLMIGLVPISALVSAFVILASQRIAIEGDHRVMLAVAHAVKISRSTYGTVFVLCLIEPLVFLGEVVAGDSWGTRITALVVHPLLRLFVIAALNEVYAEGPALEVVLREPRQDRDDD